MYLRVTDICLDFSDDLRIFANFLELFSFMICLPVFIYVDIFEFVNSLWVKWDDDMSPSVVRNASLLTDLALIRVVLSDKTGTITSGKKTMQCFALLENHHWDVIRWDTEPKTFVEELLDHTRQVTENLRYFLYGLVACNSIEVKVKDDGNDYVFISRDELAFVRCAKEIGCTLKNTSGALTIKTIQWFQETVDLISVCAPVSFTPERQRMTIAIKDPKSADHVLVLCKGSQEKIRQCLSAGNAAQRTTTEGLQHAERFAQEGGRVICFAYKVHTLPSVLCHSIGLKCGCSVMQRVRVDEFESNINQQGVNRADFLESDLTFLAPVSLEDPVESKVAKAVRSMVAFLGGGGICMFHKVLDTCEYRSAMQKIQRRCSW